MDLTIIQDPHLETCTELFVMELALINRRGGAMIFSRMTRWKSPTGVLVLTRAPWTVAGKFYSSSNSSREAAHLLRADLLILFVAATILAGCEHGKTSRLPAYGNAVPKALVFVLGLSVAIVLPLVCLYKLIHLIKLVR